MFTFSTCKFFGMSGASSERPIPNTTDLTDTAESYRSSIHRGCVVVMCIKQTHYSKLKIISNGFLS